jgi:undecaprenyl-diphosphatase
VIDVAVHVGTLGAVVLYFWTDVRAPRWAPKAAARQDRHQARGFLALCLAIATVPVVIAGLILKVTGWTMRCARSR